MMEMSNRLKKLETDLQLISTIRDILMDDDKGLVDFNFNQLPQNGLFLEQEIPVRDTNNDHKNIPKCKPKPQNVAPTATHNRNQVVRQRKTNESTKNNPIENDIRIDGDPLMDDLVENNNFELEVEGSNSRFTQRLDEERLKREEIQDSAHIVAIQLQKTEDELTRERETKRNLLVGTLEMKNQLQSYQQEISQLESEISCLKNEKLLLISKLETLEKEKSRVEKEINKEMDNLKSHKVTLDERNSELKEKAEILQKSIDDLRSNSHRNEQQLKVQEQSLIAKLDQALSNNIQVDKERQELALQLQSATNKLEVLREKSEKEEIQLQKSKQKTLAAVEEKEQQIKRLESSMKVEKERLRFQIKSAVNLVAQTKSFIINLQQEKQNSVKKSQNLNENQRKLLKEKVKLEVKGRKLIQENSQLKERLETLLEDNLEKEKKFQKEQEKLLNDFNQVEIEKNEALKKLELLKKEIENQKLQSENEKSSSQSQLESFKEELKRVSENYQILQKISEDQGRTISKQRGELDTNSKLRLDMEIKLKESLETGKALNGRLNVEERLTRDLEDQVSQLEDQLETMHEKLRDHNCQDFVDSKWMSRFKELESLQTSWESKTKSIENERDLALTAARKALRQTEGMTESCESRIGKLRSSTSLEISKLQEEKYKMEMEKSKQIHDLEAEMVRLKQSAMSMQRAYSAKIQQLQMALNMCLVGGSANSSINCFGGGFSTDINNSFI